MPNYRRFYLPNYSVFITLVTAERQPFLINYLPQLRTAIQQVKKNHPFKIIAMVVLPDHCHFIMDMPENNWNFSIRINQIKGKFSRLIPDKIILTQNRITRRERGVWQKRFWDHIIRNEEDLQHHLDYIHYNPVKHGYVSSCNEWQYSTFHRFVKEGFYPVNWATNDLPVDSVNMDAGE